jgi:hypothetical protein
LREKSFLVFFENVEKTWVKLRPLEKIIYLRKKVFFSRPKFFVDDKFGAIAMLTTRCCTQMTFLQVGIILLQP